MLKGKPRWIMIRENQYYYEGIVGSEMVATPLFATIANPLQLYHSPRMKILAFKDTLGCMLKYPK